MRKALAVSILLTLPAWVFSGEKDVGTSGAQFLKIGIGNPKALALGKSHVAMANGIQGIGYNPAGLARSNSKELALGMSSWIDDLRGHYIAYGHPFLRSNVGFSAAYMTIGDFDARDVNGLPLAGANIFARMGHVSGAFAWSLPTERIFIGLGGKMVMEDYAGSASTNFAADSGVLWKPAGPLQVGVSLMNISADAKKIPWSFRTGAAYAFPQYVTLTTDLIQDRDSKIRLGTGLNLDLAEARDIGTISMRFGFFTADNQGESEVGFLKSFKLQRTSGLSYGIGVESLSDSLYNFGFDYSLVPLGALGTSHHIALKFSF